MRKVKIFGKSIPLLAIVAIVMSAGMAGAVLVDYLSNEITKEVTTKSPIELSGMMMYRPASEGSLQIWNDGIAEWSTDQAKSGSYSVHLTAPSVEKAGNEARIVIPMPEGTTLGNIETISWWVYAVTGYPPHIDIILADDIDGTANIDSLTAEVASNSNPEDLPWSDLQESYSYDTWLRTLEISGGTGVSEIDGSTTFWVTRHGAGTADAPYGTLDELKAGTVHYPDREPDYDGVPDVDPDIEINDDVVVLRLEIEIDDWVVKSEAYVDDITIHDKTYTLEPVTEVFGDVPVIQELYGGDSIVAKLTYTNYANNTVKAVGRGYVSAVGGTSSVELGDFTFKWSMDGTNWVPQLVGLETIEDVPTLVIPPTDEYAMTIDPMGTYTVYFRVTANPALKPETYRFEIRAEPPTPP